MSVKLKSLESYPIDTFYISDSTMQMADTCMRKLEFSKFYNYNLRTRSTASDGGHALHKALGVFISTRSKEKATLSLLLSHPIDLCDNPLWKWSLEACYATLLSLINYFEKHSELEIVQIDGKNAIEVPFLINIKHGIKNFIDVKYRGYIDFILYDRLNNTYFVLDLKNSGLNIQDFTPVFKFSPQCLPYGLVLERAMGKDFSSFYVQYLVAKVDVVNAKVTPLEFEKTSLDVEEWTRDLYMKLVNIKTYMDTKWFPRKSGSCVEWSRPCRFFDLCSLRNLKTINLMLQSMEQPEARPFEPWITLDLEIQ